MTHCKQFHNKNQFLIMANDGVYFQSYNVIIAKKMNDGKIYLDADTWDYSKTTAKHRNLFLNTTTKETEKKIKSGEYILTNLN